MIIKTGKWSKEEENFLIENVTKLSMKELIVAIGRSDNSIRNKKLKMNLKSNKRNVFSEEEKQIIIDWYGSHQNELKLDELSIIINRNKYEICRCAKKLNLTNKNRIMITEDIIQERKRIKEQNHIYSIIKFIQLVKTNHPKGMLNKTHSDETKQILSKKYKLMWENKTSEEKEKIYINLKKGRDKLKQLPTSKYSKTGGYRKDLNKYFRSKWEANIARVFNYLNIDWKFEFKRFYFNDNDNGVESYLPDFYLPKLNIWIEVKGWMKETDKIRLNKFKKYYFEEYNNLLIIDENLYKKIENKYKYIIPFWEFKNNKNKLTAGVLVDDSGDKLRLIFDPFQHDKLNPRVEMLLEY